MNDPLNTADGGGEVSPEISPLPDLSEEYTRLHTEPDLSEVAPVFRNTVIRYEMFAREYVRDFNATQAARRCGYSEATCASQGGRLLQHAYIRRIIEKITGERLDALKQGEELVRETLTDMTVADPSEIFDILPDGSPRMNLLHLTKAHGKSIAAIKRDRWGGIEIKFNDRTRAAELLGRTRGMFTDKTEHSGPGGQALIPPVLTVTFKEKG